MEENRTSKRKKEHIQLCLTDQVLYEKTNGFDRYEFEHNAITEIDFSQIDLTTTFFNKKIDLPFFISCMTGGVSDAEAINEKLAIVANNLNIPIGVGSQRQALEDNKYHSSYRVIKNNAGSVPILGNLGAAQIVTSKRIIDDLKFLIDLVEADAMVIHLNPLQELLQPEGEPNFSGLLKKIELVTSGISIPFIAKEVGSGISADAARKLLDAGIQGIDVAGSGGTSWAAIELIRKGEEDGYFREWGLPTSYCVKNIRLLKSKYNFLLAASGGIKSGIDIAKSIALGADVSASAREVFISLSNGGIEAAIKMINDWFLNVKKIMFLTGCCNIKQLQSAKIVPIEELY